MAFCCPACASGTYEKLGCPGEPIARVQQGAAPDTTVRPRATVSVAALFL